MVGPPGFRSVATAAVDRAISHGSMAQIVDQKIEECKRRGVRPQDYFFLTELVNPTQAFWDRTRPDIPQPLEVLQKLKHGKKFHYLARWWFRQLPDFVASEVTYDGQYVGVPGVVGRIDYQLGDAILEFKTKEAEQVSLDDVLNRYPMDLEQLLFYAVLWPTNPVTNYLAFMTFDAQGKGRFDAFRIRIRDFERVRQEMRRRITDLRIRLESVDSSGLPLCRYHAPGCRHDRAGVCGCNDAHILDIVDLLEAVDIERDSKIAGQVKEAYDRRLGPGEAFDSWDVVLPAKWYHNLFGYAEDEELAPLPGYDAGKFARISLLTSAVYHSELGVGREEKADVPDELPEVSGPRRFLKVRLPGKKTEHIVPYTCKVWNHQAIPDADNLPDLSVTELALQCARSGSSKGAIVASFPRCGDRTMCYVLIFNLERVLRAVRGALNRMRRARVEGEPSKLESCPDFLMSTCQFTNCVCRQRATTPSTHNSQTSV